MAGDVFQIPNLAPILRIYDSREFLENILPVRGGESGGRVDGQINVDGQIQMDGQIQVDGHTQMETGGWTYTDGWTDTGGWTDIDRQTYTGGWTDAGEQNQNADGWRND